MDRMHAVQLDEPNGRLTLREITMPRPRAGQVLIRMAAAPINPSDLGALAGSSYSGERTYPVTPGIEGSGTVIEAGGGLLPRLPLSAAQQAIDAYVNTMTAGKVLLAADPQLEVRHHEQSLDAARHDHP